MVPSAIHTLCLIVCAAASYKYVARCYSYRYVFIDDLYSAIVLLSFVRSSLVMGRSLYGAKSKQRPLKFVTCYGAGTH